MGMKKLVIAEKPSVAMAYATVLGVKNKKDGYWESSDYIVSWCFGHLAELANADTYDERFAKWRREDLPILPENFKYKVPKDKYQQFAVLKQLMHREDVGAVINACDAGREGELIFRNVYIHAGCKKPILRLWLSSMEDSAIEQGFANLEDGTNYDNLFAAARCREWADWLVGINATRLFSVLYHRTLNVGRVVSPTLALLVQREAEIKAFQPEPFYTIELEFDGFSAFGNRMKSKAEAEAQREKCHADMAKVIHVENRDMIEKAPALYDLTTLQREANRLLGYTAQQTLDYAQSLYEKKLITYPRTDSRFLTDDMEDGVKALVLCSAGICGADAPFAIFSEQVCNSEKVSDHHAIVPTIGAGENKPNDLPSGERELLQMIALQVLKAVSEPQQCTETVFTIRCGGADFTAKGKRILNRGWKRYLSPEKETALPEDIEAGRDLIPGEEHIREGMTSPPKHHTEDSILSAMEAAGAREAPEDAERKGIGTPATRAGIIEKLIATGFVERRKAQKTVNLIPGSVGESLIAVLPEQLQSPLLTAEWEHKLKMVEHGKLTADAFMAEIKQMLMELVGSYAPVKGAEVLFPSGRPAVGKCPRCGGAVTESKKGFFCENHACRFGLWRDNTFLAAKRITLNKELAEKLLSDQKVRLRGIYSERSGTTYDAAIALADDGKHIRYRLVFENG